jgi:hypothetical protein
LGALLIVTLLLDWELASEVDDRVTSHWNGSGWRRVSSPSPGVRGSNLHGVTATSASNIWAVGWARTSTLIEHWNGAAWKHVASPSPGSTWNTLFGVAADSASDAWAVGWYCASTCASGSAADDTLITHWNGTAWK